jgi:hypothetical protein
MVMKKFVMFFFLLMLSNQNFAMFCPNGFNQIEIGYTLQQVIQQCGYPASKKTMKESENQPQEWNYYVKPDPSQPTTLKMSIAFDGNGKVVNITVNGTSLVNTTICGAAIQVGDTTGAITTACGKPAFTNQGQQNNQSTIEITEVVYQTTPPVTLMFKAGVLKERK